MPSFGDVISSNPKNKGKSGFPCKTRSQTEVPLPKDATEKRRSVLQSLAELMRAKLSSIKFFWT